MNLTHPPEPWTAYERDDGKWEIAHAANGQLVGTGFTKEEAERIVACVNACRGLTTEWLENHHIARAPDRTIANGHEPLSPCSYAESCPVRNKGIDFATRRFIADRLPG